ncbi:peptide ABC transporter substrate-binding protein [Mesorhizobium sp.]|uniref:peptide ABC transporter substrate-binding protein n=1 Tax=Mesorhizobium sp. TaxID=1871066 RepID=UPI000FE7019C|nr:peptide ABC transporter substrate-binding protein [Mesorhizobium sp.]RWJ31947.1 MAG: peptide ABC transporter substrate-binding protein [Mesorhizobium sp.]TIQ73847.1 MAG: peptide ABC transporter substrate-binding protein [Mesorhizobium sp.]
MSYNETGPNPSRRHVLGMMLAGGAVSVFAPNMLGRDRAMAQDGAPTGQMILGFSQEPTQFNPHMSHIEVDDGTHFALYDTLFTIDPQGLFKASLCTDVPSIGNGGISADGLQWRIKLREGVTWHDGKPFTAEDVKFTFDLLADPAFNAWRRTGFDLVRDIEIVSPTELTWRMERLFAPFPAILAGTFIVPKHGFDGVADKNAAPFNNAPIGTGPFKLVQRVPGDRIEFIANPDYFGEGPYVERFFIKYIPDVTVMYTQFVSGDIDIVGIAYIQPDNYAEATKLPDRVTQLLPSSAVECIAFNLEHAVLKELPVRQAIYHAVDKAAIISTLYYGLPTATDSYVPQQSYYYNPGLPKHEFSLEKASALLDEAGWVKGSDGIREKNGVRLSFDNSTTVGNNLREQLQQVLQQSLASIGVEMKISNMPADVLFGDFWFQSKFQTLIFGEGFLAGGDPDVTNYFKSTASNAKGGSGLNFWQFVNPEVDELLVKGSSSFVPEERRDAYFRIQEIIREQLPFMTIYQYVAVGGQKKGVDGVEPNVNVRINNWNVSSWRWAA